MLSSLLCCFGVFYGGGGILDVSSNWGGDTVLEVHKVVVGSPTQLKNMR